MARMLRHIPALLIALLWPALATAQNIAGTWRLDPARSNLRAPNGTPITAEELLTIRVRGTFIDVSFPLHSLSGMGLPRTRIAQQVRPTPAEEVITYNFFGQTAAPVSPEPRLGFALRVRTEPDLSGFDVSLTRPSPSHTLFRTTPDGETLTIETVQNTTRVIRVFAREH